MRSQLLVCLHYYKHVFQVKIRTKLEDNPFIYDIKS